MIGNEDWEGLTRDRRAFPDHVKLNDPAAGAPLVFALDSTWCWRVQAFRVLLTTSIAAPNRFLSLDYCDAEGLPWHRNPALVVQAASVVNGEYWFTARDIPVSGIAGVPQFSQLTPLWLPDGWQLRVNVAGIDVGDQLSGARMLVDKLVQADE